MENCQVCGGRLETAADRERATCGECSNRLGVIAMPPARRRAVPCRSCNGMKFIRALPREVTAVPAPGVGTLASPMTVTYQHDLGSTQTLNPRRGVGILEMYICKGCGLVDLYCADPERIPIGPQYMTQDIDYEADKGPFR